MLFRSDAGKETGGVLGVEDEVLGRVLVAELHRLGNVLALDDEREGDALADDIDARESERLRVDLGLDRGDRRRRERDGE